MHGENEQITKAFELIQLKEYAAAEEIYNKLLSDGTHDARIFCNLAIIYASNGRQQERISLLELGSSIVPDNAQIYSHLGVAYQEQGEIEKAITLYQKAINKNPSMAEAHNNIGLAFYQTKDHKSAKGSLKTAINLNPAFVDPYINLGNLHAETGEHALAAEVYAQCVVLQPEVSSHLFALGLAHQNSGQHKEAIDTYKKLLELEPQHPESLLNLASIMCNLGRADEAIYCYLSLLALDADNTDALLGYGRALDLMGYFEEAFSVYNKIRELDPSNTDNLNTLGLSLQSFGRHSDAIKVFKEALYEYPQHSAALINLAGSLRSLGDLESSISTYKKAIVSNPESLVAYKNQLFAYASASEAYALDNLELAKRYWELVRQQQESPQNGELSIVTAEAKPKTDMSKIRIGFLCADLGNHVVSTFLMPFLKDYDRSLFHVELISVQRRYEQTSSELIDLADSWYSLQGLDTTDSRKKIRSRGYNIIVETNGFTGDTGIDLLAERCASVQCHYIGYHASTGLDTIDYFIGDEVNLPREFQWQFSERLWRLPRTWLACCPYHDYPLVNNIVQKEVPVLASFNQLAKVSEEAMIFWAATLKKLPSSILLIKDRQCSDNEACQRIKNFLHTQSIDTDRLLFLPLTPNWNEHLEHYNLVDVALDTTPWSSATTAFDALGMGVPLVAIKGGCMSARMSSSIVKAVGKESWAASTPETYANIVADLCGDLSALRKTRSQRQKKFLASKLFDSADMARCLQDAFIKMLRKQDNECR